MPVMEEPEGPRICMERAVNVHGSVALAGLGAGLRSAYLALAVVLWDDAFHEVDHAIVRSVPEDCGDRDHCGWSLPLEDANVYGLPARQTL